jgi:hypothetical protein
MKRAHFDLPPLSTSFPGIFDKFKAPNGEILALSCYFADGLSFLWIE